MDAEMGEKPPTGVVPKHVDSLNMAITVARSIVKVALIGPDTIVDPGTRPRSQIIQDHAGNLRETEFLMKIALGKNKEKEMLLINKGLVIKKI